jgi:hypothetical protein
MIMLLMKMTHTFRGVTLLLHAPRFLTLSTRKCDEESGVKGENDAKQYQPARKQRKGKGQGRER